VGAEREARPNHSPPPTKRTRPNREPAARRRYLDVLLALTSRRYLGALQASRTALHQRNAAIRETVRSGRPNEAGVAVWEAPLARHGGVPVTERRAWIGEVAERYGALCAASGERAIAELGYEGSGAEAPDPAEALAQLFEVRRPTDVRRGATNTGPHRDTLAMTLDGREARVVGPAGQQRTAAGAPRLLEPETYQRRLGSAPAFLMDDPFAELDAKRGAAIMAVLRDSAIGQTFLAVPKVSDIPAGFSQLARATVEGGAIELVR